MIVWKESGGDRDVEWMEFLAIHSAKRLAKRWIELCFWKGKDFVVSVLHM